MDCHYIFFRTWEFFSPDSDFPFEKFNSYSDSSFMPRRPRKLEPSPECSPGCRNAFNLGWITTELRKFGDWSPSPKCFLMRVDEAGFAANVVEALMEWWPTSRCRVLYDHLNPRFGYVPASQFTPAVQSVINAGMDGLPKLKPADVREELQQLAAAKAMELGRSLICIYESGTPPEVTVADQTNVDLPDEEINDAIEAYMVNYGREHKSEFDRRVRDRAKRLSAALTARAKQRTHRPAAPEELVPVSCNTATPAVAAGTTESKGTGADVAGSTDANAPATAKPPRAATAEDAPGSGDATVGQTRQPTAGSHATHSPDFRYVRWNDNEFSFTKQQSTIIKLLWNAWMNRTPDVGTEALLEVADAKNSRLIDGFRNHPAWGTMIVDGQTRDAKRIAGDPPQS